jgi:peptide/nickel transport system permease protein
VSPTEAPPRVAAGAADADVEKRTSQWQVVFAQLRKNRGAMVARRLILGVVAVAVAAPLLAFNVPLLHLSEAGPRLPLLSSLFDRMLFEGGVEVFFNLLLVVLPVWLTAAALGRRVARGAPSFPTGALAVLLLLVVLTEVWAAVHARRALPVAVFGIAFPGGAFLGWSALRPRTGAARRRGRLALFGLFVVGLVAIAAVLPREESPYRVWRGPTATVSGTTVFPPIPYHPVGVGDAEALSRARKHPDAENWLGCDLNGRDVVSRIVFGLRISLTIGLVGVAIYVLIGTILGSLAGYFGGKVDLLISRLIEVMICFPTMFLLLTIIAVFESRSIFLIMAAIGFVGWPGVARLVRGEFLRQRNLDYVTAATAQGLSQRRVIFRHVLPNCLGPVLVSATFGIAGAILTESGIAFLGLGDQTAVSWGQMLTTGRASQEWHLILVPGFAIFFVVTVFNLLGEGLRDALDPKLRR